MPLMCLACACVSNNVVEVKEYFDESTYTAVIRANQSALFVARQPAISAHGGDMISIGPVHTILSNTHKQALWLGFWTTLDRHESQVAQAAPASSILIEADGLEIKLHADKKFTSAKHTNWQTYPAPSPGTLNRYFPVTDEQLRKIANAKNVLIRVVSENNTEVLYRSQTSLNPIIIKFMSFMT